MFDHPYAATLSSLSSHHDLQNIIGQWPLQCLGFIKLRAHPDIVFFRRGKDYWHGLGVYGLDDRIRRGREETIDLMRSRDRAWTWYLDRP